MDCANGSVAVIFGILLPALLGIAALGIEIGHWYSERDRLQIAADTAAYSALMAYSIDKNLDNAVAVGSAQARASGFTGTIDQIEIAIPSPDGSLGPNSSRAVLRANTRLYLSSLFLMQDRSISGSHPTPPWNRRPSRRPACWHSRPISRAPSSWPPASRWT